MGLNKLTAFLVSTAALIVILIELALTLIGVQENHTEAKEAYAKAVAQDYPAYLDGEEIDISKIDETNYVITIDTEDECIYLTHKGVWDWGQVIKVQ